MLHSANEVKRSVNGFAAVKGLANSQVGANTSLVPLYPGLPHLVLSTAVLDSQPC